MGFISIGTFSSVYKAIDLRCDEWDNTPWQGICESDINGWPPEQESHRKPLVAIKRIYATSMPERIRNELAILEDLRGCRHVSQIITAFRQEDQIVVVMPYHKSVDFRVSILTPFESHYSIYLRTITSRCLWTELKTTCAVCSVVYETFIPEG